MPETSHFSPGLARAETQRVMFGSSSKTRAGMISVNTTASRMLYVCSTKEFAGGQRRQVRFAVNATRVLVDEPITYERFRSVQKLHFSGNFSRLIRGLLRRRDLDPCRFLRQRIHGPAFCFHADVRVMLQHPMGHVSGDVHDRPVSRFTALRKIRDKRVAVTVGGPSGDAWSSS